MHMFQSLNLSLLDNELCCTDLVVKLVHKLLMECTLLIMTTMHALMDVKQLPHHLLTHLFSMLHAALYAILPEPRKLQLGNNQLGSEAHKLLYV